MLVGIAILLSLGVRRPDLNPKRKRAMKKYRTRMMLIALLGFLVSASYATPSLAETGAVSVVFTKGGFIVGVGGGQGVPKAKHRIRRKQIFRSCRLVKFAGYSRLLTSTIARLECRS